MPKAKSKAFSRIRAEVLRIVASIPVRGGAFGGAKVKRTTLIVSQRTTANFAD